MCADCKKQHVYNIHCPQCCARLVRSAKRSKTHALNLLEQIESLGGPSKEKVRNAMRETAA